MKETLRQVLFWTHLGCGIVAAIGILTMSLTGVLLTYEPQIKDLVAQSSYVPESQQHDRLPVDQLLNLAMELNPQAAAGTIVINSDPGAPVLFRSGRRGGMPLNPYSGEQLQPPVPWLDQIFSDIIGFHRWFNFDAEKRAVPRAIIGISNLIFLFLILSGLYLWIPQVLNWNMLRTRLLLRRGMKPGRARDFAWHHIFGIWSALPLIVLVISGSLFSFRWTGDLVFAAFGTERPVSTGSVSQGNPKADNRDAVETVHDTADFLSLDELFSSVSALETDWREIRITLPQENQPTVSATIDRGNGGQPQLRSTVILNRRTGDISSIQTFDALPLNQRIRSTNRFLHTGQYFGLIGQTIAGLVSAFTVLMVWTGIALAWRRLVWPLTRRGDEFSGGDKVVQPR